MATKTKRKKKPTCVKGQACGYACIPLLKKNGEPRGCGQPVPKDVAGVNLDAVPAKGKNKAAKQNINAIWEAVMKDKSKVAMSVIKEVDYENSQLSKSDTGLDFPDDLMVKKFGKLAKKAGIDKDTALAMGTGLRAWVGLYYTKCSPLTYKPTNQIQEIFTGDNPIHVTKENVAILATATAALKVLPSIKVDDSVLKKDSGYKDWDKQTLNRWVDIRDGDIDVFLKKYQKGATITEDGMFGASIHNGETMPGDWSESNVTFEIKPKLDGTGRGKYIENLKKMSVGGEEGEVLYVPGTKFTVSDVTIVESEEYDEYVDKVIKKRRVKIKLEES